MLQKKRQMLYDLRDGADWKLQSILDWTAYDSTICAMLTLEEVIWGAWTSP